MYNNVKIIRENKKISITELSRKSGLSRNTIYLIESNKVIPSIATILKLSAGLNEEPEKIFNLSVIQVLQKEK
ncbi:TPA: helix-turn-helix transcriptional regulator [Staphylococcus pseudintermedius]|uniref:helix-turn-helix transcriptional regulator n=1 Tax=Staphylococcus pseudintermedius TaxID=283734 RepID=UPI000BBB7D3A|nr:helix-turn-helix transcriptional regulator [Staphylococcus pseudintermedius]EGQ1777956.1 XRE family transcriptional regulator [Staphylococcus pseudintermedius]EGQ3552921.1 helix-turn-helix transcriptional regulator [Staphylococcus pseudintermedius]EHT3469683.1 helix-turn-helix transcriptional regulator [Staphylococcus pseudintermedius]EIQ3900101.1 helix-turn-helix transcriptional regulator [Staphylococcus pseudintermedius]MDK3769464.1 helix-turn-helix transcriptional regulator [Staphylococc